MAEHRTSNGQSPLSTGDIVVTPAVSGYDVGVLDGDGWHLLKTAGTWDTAVRKARYLGAVTPARVWASRDGEAVEPLVFPPNGPDDRHEWLPFDRTSVLAHAPDGPGLYALCGRRPLYIGETENVRERLLYHLEIPLECPEARGPLRFAFAAMGAQPQRGDQKSRLVACWSPPCNEPA